MKVLSTIKSFTVYILSVVVGGLFLAVMIAIGFIIELPYSIITHRKRKRENLEYKKKIEEKARQEAEDYTTHVQAIENARIEMEKRFDPNLDALCVEFDNLLRDHIISTTNHSNESTAVAYRKAKDFLDTHRDELRKYLEPIKQFAGAKGNPGLVNHHWRTAHNAFLEE